ncbi:hypothetical protein G7K_1163-t1 [Saitoella complicata NRRL Y-17804]|uniref:Uncharacterized protein n=1 Tax=Saitoella complicata (strain BCRC 22490 / CBS 7301 / JCM 7358 / NBRC 10748 / NRRL Y-17804) TaxID=698492 RepID=A0A0E9NB80_SAICN|nr:hypothetical protein G7K_1163-t1 [Saitoella complicata NRRL Y-17804]
MAILRLRALEASIRRLVRDSTSAASATFGPWKEAAWKRRSGGVKRAITVVTKAGANTPEQAGRKIASRNKTSSIHSRARLLLCCYRVKHSPRSSYTCSTRRGRKVACTSEDSCALSGQL